jgi:hypothetical protein
MAEQSALRQYEYGGEGLFGFLMPVRREILSPEQQLVEGYTETRRGPAVEIRTVPAQYGEPERDPTYSPLYRGLKNALHFLYDIGNNREQATETVQTALRGVEELFKDQYTAAALGGTAYNPETGGVTEFDPTIAMVGGAPAGVQAVRAATPGSVVLGMVGSKNARLTPQTGDLDMSHAARMQRAVEGDWNPDRPVYHWTEAPDIEEFIPSTEGKLGAGVYASPIPSYGERYVDQSKAIAMPLNYRGQLAGIQDFDDAYNVARSEMPNLTGSEAVRAWRARANDVLAERGFTGREVGGEVLIFDPKNIRSTSAAFDPAQRGSSNILASGSKLGTGVAVVSGFSKMNRYDLDETLSAVRESWPFSYDISWEELMTPESLKELPGNVKNLVKALWKEDGLGFDNPAQAISTVLSEDAGNYDITPQLKSAVTKLIRSPADIQPPAPQGLARSALNDLDMSYDARMQRADQMGMTTEAYSGSTHDIDRFRGDISNPENDWGRGTYASTSIDDVNTNYAGVGPDLTGRIETESERVADALSDYPDELLSEYGFTLEDYNRDEAGVAEAIARKMLVGDAEGGIVYPLRINTEKYAVIGGPDSTTLDIDLSGTKGLTPYSDEYYEALNEASDDLYQKVYDAISDTDAYQSTHQIEMVMSDVSEYLADGQLDLSDLDYSIRRHITDAYDDYTGDMVSPGGISAQVLKNLGYEGVIDNTVDTKFGTGRSYGQSMAGVNPDTQHIITFPDYESRIRSTYAKFDPSKKNSSDILAGIAGGSLVGGSALSGQRQEKNN